MLVTTVDWCLSLSAQHQSICSSSIVCDMHTWTGVAAYPHVILITTRVRLAHYIDSTAFIILLSCLSSSSYSHMMCDGQVHNCGDVDSLQITAMRPLSSLTTTHFGTQTRLANLWLIEYVWHVVDNTMLYCSLGLCLVHGTIMDHIIRLDEVDEFKRRHDVAEFGIGIRKAPPPFAICPWRQRRLYWLCLHFQISSNSTSNHSSHQ